MKKLLSILVSLFVIANNTVPAFAVDENTGAESSNGYPVELRDLTGNKSPYLALGSSEKKDEEPEFEDSDVVRVSIFLDDLSTLEKGYDLETIAVNRRAVSYRNQLEKKQDKVENSIEKKIGYNLDVKWNLTLATNVISANVKYGDIAEIEKIKGVKSVALEQQYSAEEGADEPNTAITTENMVMATELWDNGYSGQERLVAIIDTGTNQDHISFQADALEYSLTKDGKELSDYDLLTPEKIASVADLLNSGVNEANNYGYLNTKLPYAYNYIDDNYTTDHASDTQGEHGSHVAGISAANRYVSDGNGGFVEAADSVFAVGVAPDAQILTMKVFGQGGGAYDSDYFAAIEDALVLGADSINLSLGSSVAGFAFSEGYQKVLDKLPENSSVVTISAGNSYSWSNYSDFGGYLQPGDAAYHTGGSPGSFTNAFTIASAENIGQIGSPLTFDGSLKSFYTESSHKGGPISSLARDEAYEYVYLDAFGSAEEYEALNNAVALEGKVVIVNRGSLTFVNKGNNLVSYNPAALIIANNQAGTISMALDDFTGSFPMVSITLADADTLKEKDAAGTVTVGEEEYAYYIGTLNVSNKTEAAVTTKLEDTEMSDFSSWGGAGSLLMKPELTTPGGNIYSVNGMTNDQYELMSGTSMAAPHAAGIAALLAQYIEENDLAKYTDGNPRTLINSLMMSTATPMKNDGRYVSIIQQGAGLANTANAMNALTFIQMDAEATSAAADGKVKVELGDDPTRSGSYSYGFTITNMSDEVLSYDLTTDMFTQALEEGYVAPYTIGLGADVTYVFDTVNHDVNKDGVTDEKDVQAILDVVSGVNDGSAYDLDAAEVDGTEGITSYDAHVLLKLLQDGKLTLRANESKHVTVNINLQDKDALNATYENGFYVQGFTRVQPTAVTEEGVQLDVEHSIPVYGFYGSITDPSMFDRGTILDKKYKSDVISYTGNADTNYLNMVYPGSNTASVFTGNPYLVEDTFPWDKLAISSSSRLTDAAYTLMREAGSVAPAVVKVDEAGNAEDVLFLGKISANVYAPYYNQSNGAWAGNSATTARINKAVSELDVQEGDKISVGVYAVPEYNAMKLNGSTSGTLTEEQFKQLLTSGELGDGARMGFTFTVDNTAAEILNVEYNKEKRELTITAKDNQYIAYVGVTDLNGEKEFASAVPEQNAANETVTVKLAIPEDCENAAAIVVGDYAGNETAKLAILGDGPVTMKRTIYKEVDEIKDGGEYIITDSYYEGPANAVQGVGALKDVANVKVNIVEKDGENVILNSDADNSIVWVARAGKGGYSLANKAIGHALYAMPSYNPMLFTYGSGSAWDYEDSALYTDSAYVQFDTYSSSWIVESGDPYDANGYVVLYEKTEYEEEIDPTQVQRIVVNPENSEIYGIGKTTTLNAVVYPAFIEDQSVTWTSSDESVATVDENGVVTSVAAGKATITATSNATPSVSGSAEVTVLVSEEFPAVVFAQVTDSNGMNFSAIDLKDASVTPVAQSYATLVGGGRDGDFIYAYDTDGDFDKFTINEDGTVTPLSLFQINEKYAPLDATNWFTLHSTKDGVEYVGVDDMYTFAVTSSGYFVMYNDEGNLNGWNLSSLGTHVGIAFAGAGTDKEGIQTAYYYGLSADGKLNLFVVTGQVNANAEGELELQESVQYMSLGTVSGLNLSNDNTAYSLSYVGYQTEEEQLVLADNVNKNIYAIDVDLNTDSASARFITNLDVESISTLFNNDFDTVNSVVGDKYSSVELQNVDAPLEVIEAKTAEASQLAGTTNAIRNRGENKKVTPTGPKTFAPLAETATGNDEEGNTVLSYSETVDVTNGVVSVSYDPAKTTFAGVDVNTNAYSVNATEKGTVKLAFANLDAVDAGNVVANFKFDACEDDSLTLTVLERSSSLALNEETEEAFVGQGHAWKLAGFDWKEDHSAAVANFVCENDADHKHTVDATVTVEETEGKKVYTATVVFEDQTYTDVYEEAVVTPAEPEKPSKPEKPAEEQKAPTPEKTEGNSGAKTADASTTGVAAFGLGLSVVAVLFFAFLKKKKFSE